MTDFKGSTGKHRIDYFKSFRWEGNREQSVG